MTAAPRIIVFAKAPVPGLVKTRLVPPLTETQAAEFAEACLLDTLAAAAISGAAVDLAYSPAESGPDMTAWLDRRIARGLVTARPTLGPQQGEDLGQRMCAALATALAAGAPAALVVGSDAPDMPPSRLGEAFAALQGPADAVLGACPDGGYYLIGLNRPPPPGLLEGIAWSSGGEGAVTRARLAAAGFGVAELDAWPDVDTPADLAALAARLAADASAAPRTAAWISSVRGRDGTILPG